jgi:hypothetical protein
MNRVVCYEQLVSCVQSVIFKTNSLNYYYQESVNQYVDALVT